MDMFKPNYEEVDLIKDFTKKKDTKRTVHITSGIGNPTIVLKKGTKIKETFNLIMVNAVETSQSTNLIQLTSDKGEVLTIRTKSRASKDKFLKYLKAGLPQPANTYDVVHKEPRTRAVTVNTDDRRKVPRTPRRPDGYQSGVVINRTQLPLPMASNDLLSVLPEDEYDISNSPPPYGSLRSNEERSLYNESTDPKDHVYDEAATTIEVRSSECHQYLVSVSQAAAKEVGYINDHVIATPRRTPLPNNRNEVPDTLGYAELRKDYGRGQLDPPNYMRCNMGETVHAREDTENNGEDYEDVTDPDTSGKDKQIYYEKALKCEIEQGEKVTRGFERQNLQKLKLKAIEPHGICIVKVPASLKHSFYQGDRIVNINSQTITDVDFAKQIVKTSANKMVQVTIDRLFMGHLIDIKLQDDGEPLGFELDGTKIKSISPGTHFGRQAHRLLETAMCITHINTEFVPLGTSKKEVKEMLRDAGLSFFLILQPVHFAKDLNDN